LNLGLLELGLCNRCQVPVLLSALVCQPLVVHGASLVRLRLSTLLLGPQVLHERADSAADQCQQHQTARDHLPAITAYQFLQPIPSARRSCDERLVVQEPLQVG
jgi:maltodextrin utilization protein YvdJ